MIFLLFLVFLGICHVQGQLPPATNPLQQAIDNSTMVFDQALSVPLPAWGNSTVNLGFVTVPFGFLCQQPGIIADITCHICYLDCFNVHNLYGGQCGMDPTPKNSFQSGGPVCICNTQPYPNGTLPTAGQHCGPILDPSSDDILDDAIVPLLLIRKSITLCGNGGCGEDVNTNHQFDNGTCGLAPSIPTFPGDVPVIKTYCLPKL